jgi:hypothetical protein
VLLLSVTPSLATAEAEGERGLAGGEVWWPPGLAILVDLPLGIIIFTTPCVKNQFLVQKFVSKRIDFWR